MRVASYRSDRPWELSSREKGASVNGLVIVSRPVGDGRWAVAQVDVQTQLPVAGKIAIVSSEQEAKQVCQKLAQSLQGRNPGRVAHAQVVAGQKVSSQGRSGSVIRLYPGLRMASVRWEGSSKPSLVAQELLSPVKEG